MSRIASLEKLLKSDPADADLLYMMAQEHAKAGDDAAAIDWYDRCLAANPGYHYAYFHKARVLERTGRREALLATLRDGVARAHAAGDEKALGELRTYLQSVED